MDANLSVPKSCYAVINNKDDVREQSSSGGAFSALADWIIARGGVVYGCAFDQNTVARHVRVSDSSGLGRLRGSKYVQSDISDAFAQVKNDLDAGHWVLFTGTPCQVASIKAFIGCGCQRLLTADIVCHGVPSSDNLTKSLKTELDDAVVESLKFRDKRYGWGTKGSVAFRKGQNRRVQPFTPLNSSYYARFLEGAMYRPSCYRCPYARPQRPGDFTLGDFWGIDGSASQQLDARKGISLVLVNSARAVRLFAEVFANCRCIKRPIEEAMNGNDQLRHPVLPPAAWKYGYVSELESFSSMQADLERRNILHYKKWQLKQLIKKVLRK